MDRDQARLCRDIAIGCAGRLAGCVGFMRGKFPSAKQWAVAGGLALYDVAAVAKRIITLFPELKVTDEEWDAIAAERAGHVAVQLGDRPRARLLLDIGAVEDRVLTIRSTAPELETELTTAISSLGAFAKLVDEKVPEHGDS